MVSESAQGSSAQARPRIGIYDPSGGFGGPSRYVQGILDQIDQNEFDVVIFGNPEGPHHSRPVPIIDCVKEAPAPGTLTNSSSKVSAPQAMPSRRIAGWIPHSVRLWAGFWRESKRLERRFRTHPVDLLHTNNTGCEESAVAARLAGIPRVLGTFHVDSTYDLHRTRSSLPYRVLEYLSNHCLNRAIAVSEATKQDWVRRTRISVDRVITIHNGVDLDAFRPRHDRELARRALGLPSNGHLIIGSVGRLDEAKGFSDLIDAVAEMAPAHPRLSLAIAGDGPLRRQLADQTVSLGIADRVHFLGFQRDVGQVLEAFDIFAMPSLCETIGYALMEAMAMELPAVGSSVGGIPEVILPGVTGAIVPARNPQALAAALRPLVESSELRERMGRAARQQILRHFDGRESSLRTLQVYRDMLSGKGRAQ